MQITCVVSTLWIRNTAPKIIVGAFGEVYALPDTARVSFHGWNSVSAFVDSRMTAALGQSAKSSGTKAGLHVTSISVNGSKTLTPGR
jgi:hypothetical protein